MKGNTPEKPLAKRFKGDRGGCHPPPPSLGEGHEESQQHETGAVEGTSSSSLRQVGETRRYRASEQRIDSVTRSIRQVASSIPLRRVRLLASWRNFEHSPASRRRLVSSDFLPLEITFKQRSLVNQRDSVLPCSRGVLLAYSSFPSPRPLLNYQHRRRVGSDRAVPLHHQQTVLKILEDVLAIIDEDDLLF